VEEVVAWLVVQSLVVLVPAFLLGVVVGWLWWRRRKVHFSESGAVREVTARNAAALAAAEQELHDRRTALRDQDLEMGRLSTLVSGDTLVLAAQHERELAVKDEQVGELRAQLQMRDTQLGSRAVELGTRDAEIDRLAELVEAAEARAAGHADDLATRDDRLAALEAAARDRDAEIGRLSAALNAAAATASGATGATGTTGATGAAEAAAPGARAAAERGAVSTVPTDPTPDQIAAFLTPLEDTGALAVEAAGAEPAAPSADDLERIEGIGPRIGAALRGAGILTFRQVAEADIATLQAALEQAGLRFAPSLPTWSRQAELLADGDEVAFSEIAERLVTGRDAFGAKGAK
jgi:predicted flap endonuclease-1-like 5' DNA nuclease